MEHSVQRRWDIDLHSVGVKNVIVDILFFFSYGKIILVWRQTLSVCSVNNHFHSYSNHGFEAVPTGCVYVRFDEIIYLPFCRNLSFGKVILAFYSLFHIRRIEVYNCVYFGVILFSCRIIYKQLSKICRHFFYLYLF
jgi:hypothetical protein